MTPLCDICKKPDYKDGRHAHNVCGRSSYQAMLERPDAKRSKGERSALEFAQRFGGEMDAVLAENSRLRDDRAALLAAAILARNTGRCTVALEDRNQNVNYMAECNCALHSLNRAIKLVGEPA